MHFMEDPDVVKKRQSVLDVGQRNQLEAVQTEIRRNNETLTTLRRENKELRLALQQSLRGQRELGAEDHYQKEEELLHNKMCVLKRSLNAVRGKNQELAKEIERTVEETGFVVQEGNDAMEESSPIAEKIRALENRLDKCLIKHNEVAAIRRTYETLLERLQLEHAGFDVQLAAAEKALQNSGKELAELTAVGQDAQKDRDQAKSEVARLKNRLVEERQKQRKDMEQRRAFVMERREALEKKDHALQQKIAQQEERHMKQLQGLSASAKKRGGTRSAASSIAPSLPPEEVERLQSQKEAYQHLKDITMAGNVTEVIDKLVERRESLNQLKQTAEELEEVIADLQREKQALQNEWDTVNQRAGGAMVSPRVVRAARAKQPSSSRGVGSASPGSDPAGLVLSDDDGEGTGATGGGDVTADYRLLGDRRRENQRIVAEFESHLERRQAALEDSQKQQEHYTQLFMDVEAGVQHLAEKLSVLREGTTGGGGTSSAVAALLLDQSTETSALPATSPLKNEGLAGSGVAPGGATPHHHTSGAVPQALITVDLLRSCGAKLRLMLEELTSEEVARAARAMAESRVMIPDTNIRIPAIAAAAARQGTAGSRTGVHFDGGDDYTNTSVVGGRGDEEEGGDLGRGRSVIGAGKTSSSMAGGGSMVVGMAASGVASAAGGGSASAAHSGGGGAGSALDDFPDNEIRDRVELKMMSMATVERETKRARKQMVQRRKDESA